MFRSTRIFRAVAVTFVGFLIFGGTGLKMFIDTDVLRNGVKTVGQITDTSRYLERSGDDSFQRYRAHYTFQDANGVIYDGQDTIEKATYESYVIGQTIDVYYYPTDPSTSFVDIDGKISVNRLQLLIGGALAIGGLAGLLLVDYQSRNN